MDDPDGIAVALVVLAGDVAAAATDAHAHGEVGALTQRADDVLGVHEIELGGDIEIAAGHGAGAVDVDRGLGLIAGTHRAEHEALHVEHDIGDVLVDALDGRELMLHAIDHDGLHSRALEGGQQHAAKGVAERLSVAMLERLDAHAREILVNLLYRHLRSDEFGHCYLQYTRSTWSRARR